MTVSVDHERRTRITTYVLLGVVFLLLTIVAVFVYRSVETGAEAQRKADQLAAELADAGLRVPSDDQLVRVLGDDGGAVCADPNAALQHAALNAGLSNGAAGPGIRPVIAEHRLIEGFRIVIGVYCPEELGQFNAYVRGYRLDDVAGV